MYESVGDYEQSSGGPLWASSATHFDVCVRSRVLEESTGASDKTLDVRVQHSLPERPGAAGNQGRDHGSQIPRVLSAAFDLRR